MQTVLPTNSEAAILSRVIQPEHDDLPPAVARAFLKLSFTTEDRERMHELAVKNQAGKLSAADQQELNGYLRVGRLLDLLGAKARLSLQKRTRNAWHHGRSTDGIGLGIWGRDSTRRSLLPFLFGEFVQQIQAVRARYRRCVVGGDAFHLGPVCGLPVAGVAKDHAVKVQGVPVALLPFVL